MAGLIVHASDAAAMTKTDFLYEQLVNRVISGDYPPNMRIPSEEDIAREFDVSRSVVRNALARLKREGVLGSRRGSGTTVKQVNGAPRPSFGPLDSIEDIWNCFEFRINFEAGVAGLAARRHVVEDLGRIEAALNRLGALKSSDMLETVDLDIAFHESVVNATHNRFLIGTYEAWKPQIRFTSSMSANLSQSWSDVRKNEMVRDHGRILERVRARDPAGAREAMVAHIKAARLTVFRGRFVYGDDEDEG